MGKDCVVLQIGKLKVSVDSSDSKMSLYWNDTEFTQDCGFISIIGAHNGNRYYSVKASWMVNKVSDREFQILLKWPDLPMEEYWNVVIKDEKTIDWKISVNPLKKMDIEHREIGLMLSSDYTQWITSSEKGIFPPIKPNQTEWKDVPINNSSVKAVGVISCIKNELYKPPFILDFKEVKRDNELKVRNSHIFANSRSLSVIIKYNRYFGIDSLSKNQGIFVVKLKITDNYKTLVKYLESYKKADRQRWKELHTRRQNATRSYEGILDYLFLRLKEHYRKGGILYAIYRGIMYVVYCIRITNLPYVWFSIGRFKDKQRPKYTELKLESGRLKLIINAFRSAIDIYWSNVKLTKDLGFITVMGERNFIYRRHYSNQAIWEINSNGTNQVNISLSYPGFPVLQEWVLTLEDERTIRWDIRIFLKRRIIIVEKEVGIMVSADYSHWISSYEEGEFLCITPHDKEWRDVKFWNLSSKSIGVKGYLRDKEFKPAVILDFEETMDETRPIIRNSDYRADLRTLLVQINTHKPLQMYKSGLWSNMFSGKIKIIDDEALVEQNIINCKKSLYRQRLPFIEEKMTKKYLSDILKSVEVILVNLPWKRDDNWGVRAGSRWPHIKNKGEGAYIPFPFFLAYTASVFLEYGISVRIIDAIAENMERADLVKLISEIKPKLLIAEVSTPSLENDLDILNDVNREDTKIAVCGLDFNIRQPDFLKKNNFIDFVMVGEYEYTALDLFRNITNDNKLKEILGLIYRDNGDIKINPTRPPIEDLDKLPWPLREQLPMEQYTDTPGNIPFPSVQMLASRGCPFRCIFCAWPQLMYNGNLYRMRKAERIVDEMEYLIKERKFKSVYFDDDTFNINKKNVLEICKEIKERKLDIPWAAMARADTMDEEMLINLKEAGLYAVKYGVESAEQRLLDNARKNMNLKQAERMICFTKSLGIKTHLTFTFGLPGETKDTIKKTIDYAIELDPDTVQFSIMTPYPGTEYYNQLETKGYIVSKNWSDYDGASKSVIRTEYLSPADLEKAKDEALRLWKRHKRSKRSFITMPFDQELKVAFKNNLKSRGLFHTLIKTTKFIFNI